MKQLHALFFLISFSASLLACGPIIPMEQTIDNSDEARYFREDAEGTWNSECNGYTDSTGKPASVLKQIKMAGKSASLRQLAYENYTCTGTVKTNTLYSTTVTVIEATSEKDVIVEFTNQAPREGHFVNERSRIVLRNSQRMETTLVGRSVLRKGEVLWLDESDLGNGRAFSFTRVTE